MRDRMLKLLRDAAAFARAHRRVAAAAVVAVVCAVVALVCIVGRAWCSLYIGGRKKAEIVDRGPYSISRNPLYVFSFMGAFGVGAQTGSVTLACMPMSR